MLQFSSANRAGHGCGACVVGAVAGLLAAALGAAVPPASGQCHYTWTVVLNPNPNEGLSPVAINNHGHVAGDIFTFAEERRGFFWSPETGLVRIPMPTGFNDMLVSDLNDLGHVLGTISSSTLLTYRGFIWDGADFTFIDMPPWANQLFAYGLNNEDQVVGVVLNGAGPVHAFFWDNDTFLDLGDFGGTASTEDKGISDRVEMVGTAYAPIHAGFVSGLNFQPRWLPNPDGFARNLTRSVSNSGFVVGVAYRDQTNSFSRPVIWHHDEVVAVYDGPPGASTRRIERVNSAGRAVGSYTIASRPHGVVWQNGIVYELSELTQPPREIGSAKDINDRGEILFLSSAHFGILHPVWLDGDLTGDCHVTIEDLLVTLSNFGSPAGSFPPGDADLDGDVDLSDLAVVLSNFGG